ncbi:beta-lactamase-like protein [Syncephalis fuscata]|nr:beta-lactamase-like protein [Syncephalis fuscata]
MSGLTPLANIEVHSRRVIRVLGLNPGPFTLQGLHKHIFVGSGPKRILIDTGEGIKGYVPQLVQALKQNNDNNGSANASEPVIDQVLLTHWHRDHVGGLADDHTLKPVANGDVFHVDDCTLIALHTPGHTRDHLAFYLEEEEAIFTGDCVLGEKTTIFEDLPVYLESLERLKGLHAKRLYPGHGPIVDGEDNVQTLLDTYIDHRMARDEEILKLMQGWAPNTATQDQKPRWTVTQLVESIYPNVPETVALAAGRGLLLHLVKLRNEKRVDVVLSQEHATSEKSPNPVQDALAMTRLTFESIVLLKDLQWQLAA